MGEFGLDDLRAHTWTTAPAGKGGSANGLLGAGTLSGMEGWSALWAVYQSA